MIARFQAWVCGHSCFGIAGSNLAGGIDVSFECCYAVRRRADHSTREVVPNVVCTVSVIAKPLKGRPQPGIGSKRPPPQN